MRDLTPTVARPTATVSAPLSPREQALILIRDHWTVAPTGTPDGATALKRVPSTWTPPIGVTLEVRQSALDMLGTAEKALRPATADEVKRWLISIGTMVASTLTRADAEVKACAIAAIVEAVPVGVIAAKETMRRAGRAWRFFPTFQEADEFLQSEAKTYRQNVARLRSLSVAPLAPSAPDRVKAEPMATAQQHHRRWMEHRLAAMAPEERAEAEASLARLRSGGSIAEVLGAGPATDILARARKADTEQSPSETP